MWSSRFLTVAVIAAPLFLAACGFTPMYGGETGQAITTDYQNVEVDNIPDRDGQFLRNLLIDKLYQSGRPADAPYLLKVEKLTTDIVNIGIRRDATSTRGQMQIDAHVMLIDRKTNQILLDRNLRSVGAYNQLDNQFATLVSKDSLRDHVLEEMSDSIMTEIGLYFRRTPDSKTP